MILWVEFHSSWLVSVYFTGVTWCRGLFQSGNAEFQSTGVLGVIVMQSGDGVQKFTCASDLVGTRSVPSLFKSTENCLS